MADKTLLSDLKKKVFIRSTLLGIHSLDELLGINDYVSADEVLQEIFKKALREFELTTPLIWESTVDREQLVPCDSIGDGYYELKSNFTSWLKCIIPLNRVILVFNSMPMWRVGAGSSGNTYAGFGGTSSYPGPGAYQYVTDYRKPYVFLDDLPQTTICLKGLTSYPIIPDFTPKKSFNEKSENSAIFFLDVETGARGNFFMDLCMVHLLDYIRQLKASLQLPNMSVDVLSNVDASYQELRSRCDNYSLQSGWYGELLL